MNPSSPVQPALSKRNFDSPVIRPMRLEDLPRVQEIDRLSFTLPWPESAFRYELLENPPSLLWVAEIEQEDGNHSVVGCLVVWLIMDEAHIATIAVHPEYRQHAIAKRLMAEMLREVIKRGAHLATLEVREHNIAAQRLYQRFGFEIVGRRARYYQDNHEDAIIMTIPNLSANYSDWLDSDRWMDVGEAKQDSRLNA